MVFLLLPGILWMRRSRLVGFLGTVLILVLDLAAYKIMIHYFTSPYYESILDVSFTDVFKDEGFSAGCLFLFHKVYDQWIAIRWNMSLGVRQGCTEGQIYFASCFAMLLLFMWLLVDIVKIKRQSGHESKAVAWNLLLESDQLLAFGAMFFAILASYPIPEGSRHMLVFLVSFIVIGTMRDERPFEKNILTAAVFVYLFVVKYDGGSGYLVPYAGEDIVRQVEDWDAMFSACISLDRTDVPDYDNVVDWVIADVAGEEVKEVPWKVLFALPEGIGINCCFSQYITENIDELNSRYIIAVPDGQVDRLCQEREMDMLLRDTCFVLYQND
ncbi:MAG: hypothetical protein NC121_20500 [Blautia sp.]|nr:hypothetical protein [Blautia sp.]